MASSVPMIPPEQVVRLWLHQQGLLEPRGTKSITKKRLIEHLERTGGIQIDPINVVDRAPYLTLWSRFGVYKRSSVDRWIYGDRVAFEYWGHEASIIPMSHLPLGRRRMVGFPPKQWRGRAWWSVYQTPLSSKRRVLKRLTNEGPLESSDFQGGPRDGQRPGGTMPLTKEDGRSLKLLWHSGKVAVSSRRTWRCVYDLAERVYPEGKPAGIQEYKNSWLMRGLSGNGVVSEGHLVNYITAPDLASSERKAVIADAVKREQVLRVQVKGLASTFYVSPEHFDLLSRLPPPSGTNLICPFDSFLWQRRRAEELLGFRYRIEIYVPPAKRQFGYYVTPILHEGRLVGRLDPKMHREEGRLEIRSVHLESGFKTDRRFEHGLGSAIRDLAEFLGADRVDVPKRGPRIRGV